MSGTHVITSLGELRRFAGDFALRLEPNAVVLLEGPMGAGKTQLTSYLVSALGGADSASPSYAIHESYALSSGTLEHFDLFRIESESDLESTGFWDAFALGGARLVIEWAERLTEFGVREHLPRTRPVRVLRLHVAADGERRIEEF